jgi:hypothetical protein
MLDFADMVALNKFDKRGALDALRDVRKQYSATTSLWDQPPMTNARIRHHRLAVQRPGHERALPARKTISGKNARSPAVLFPRHRGDEREDLHHPAAPHALPVRNFRNQPRYNGWAEQQAELARKLLRTESLKLLGIFRPEPMKEACGCAAEYGLQRDLEKDLDGKPNACLETWAA